MNKHRHDCFIFFQLFLCALADITFQPSSEVVTPCLSWENGSSEMHKVLSWAQSRKYSSLRLFSVYLQICVLPSRSHCLRACHKSWEISNNIQLQSPRLQIERRRCVQESLGCWAESKMSFNGKDCSTYSSYKKKWFTLQAWHVLRDRHACKFGQTHGCQRIIDKDPRAWWSSQDFLIFLSGLSRGQEQCIIKSDG